MLNQEDSDLDDLKDIPVFKPILRAIIRSQMKHLVKQLSRHGGEEAMLLTASVSDGSFDYLGSTVTEGFLDTRCDIRDQFLDYCMRGFNEADDTKGEDDKTTDKASPGKSPRNSRRQTDAAKQASKSGVSPVSLIKVDQKTGARTVAAKAATTVSSAKVGRERPSPAVIADKPPKRSISESVSQALKVISAETEEEMEEETVGSFKLGDHGDPDYNPTEDADSSDTMSLDLGAGTKAGNDRMKEFIETEQPGPSFDLEDFAEVKVEPAHDDEVPQFEENTDQLDFDIDTEAAGAAAVDGDKITEPVVKKEKKSFDANDQIVPTLYILSASTEGTKGCESTKKKTKHHMQLIKDYLRANGETCTIESMPLNELDVNFGKFLLSVRKQDGTLYGACSMMGFVSSLNRYLKDTKEYPYQIARSLDFKFTQSVLNQKIPVLKAMGVGIKKTSEDDKLNANDLEKLFQMGEIGLQNPKAVINFLYVSIMCGLGIKHYSEMFRLKWGEIALCVTDSGVEFLTHVKGIKPVPDPETSEMVVMSDTKPKIFGNASQSRCPIEAYKLYACKRPVSMNNPHSPFFLSIVCKHPEVGQAWYHDQRLGKHSAGSLMKELIRKSRHLS